MIYTTVALVVLIIAAWWIIRGQNKMASAIDDLKAAVARNGASTSAALKAISEKLAAEDPDVEAAAVALNSLSDKLDAETAVLTAPETPATPAV